MDMSRAAVSNGVMTKEEMLRFLDFIDEVENEAEHVLPLRVADPYYRIINFLIRQHLEARPVTVSSLAAAAGVPYATAMRRIDELLARDLILRRPRTRTGKSFSLHPSRALIDQWYDYARRVKRVIGKTFGMSEEPAAIHDYFFGGSYMAARIIAPPTVGTTPLGLKTPLRLLLHADPTFMAMQTLKRQLEQIFGVPIQTRALSIDRLRAAALQDSTAKSSSYDIIAVDMPWVGEFATQGVLRPLDDLIARARLHTADFHPAGWQGGRYGGQQYGVPIQTTPELFFYRTDLFAEAGIEPPTTTAAVLDAARALHRPEQGQRGIAWNAARGTAMGHTFMMVMAAFGRPILDLRTVNGDLDAHSLSGERMRPAIDTAEGRLAADYLFALLEYSPRDILTMSWFERVVAYAKGEVAMAYGYSLLAPYFELNPAMPAHGKTGFLPHPRGPHGENIAPVGGYLLGIPANLLEERVAGTWQALEFLTSAEAIKLYMTNGSLTSPRFSVSADPEVRVLSPLIPAVDELARAGRLRFWPRPPAPEISALIAICGEEMHDMASGLKTPAAALRTAQNRADQLMRGHGHY